MTILKTIKLLGLAAVLALGPFSAKQASAQPGVTVPVESFYNELAPYGQWTQHPNYGNVWLPNADPGFQPYSTGGHWLMTEYGNTWVSDYAWGWAPFHYGRWIHDPAYGGWGWIPGTDWGPAWVSWRSGGGYYGWAPLGPGVNINITIPAPYWTFVPQAYFTSPRWYSYCAPRPQVVNIYQNTTIINNYYRTNNRAYVYGPHRGDIERYTRQSVPVYRIDQMDRPGRSVIGNSSIGFYRPGQASDHRQAYGRNDRFDNPTRPNYSGNNAPGRGNYDVNRDSYDAGNNVPNRGYEGTNNVSSRGNYGGNNSVDRRRDYNNPTPNSGDYSRPQSSGFESSRGTYSPGSAQIGNSPQPPNRSYERVERQSQINSQSMPDRRSEGGFQRSYENRSMQSQPRQERPQRSENSVGQGGASRGQRGPR